MKFLLSLICLTFFYFQSFSQEESQKVNTIENQFDTMYRLSSSYLEYKVINKEDFLNLKKSILDSLTVTRKIIDNKNLQLTAQQQNIAALNQNLVATQIKLKNANATENSISLFGLKMSKISYNLLLWSLIVLLLAGILFYFFKYKSGHVYTKEAQEKLTDVESEFEEFRKKTLIKEQKLRRQLQDEINKQK